MGTVVHVEKRFTKLQRATARDRAMGQHARYMADAWVAYTKDERTAKRLLLAIEAWVRTVTPSLEMKRVVFGHCVEAMLRMDTDSSGRFFVQELREIAAHHRRQTTQPVNVG